MGDLLASKPRIAVVDKSWHLMSTSEKVENHENRLQDVENVFEIADKIWKYLKIMTPALIVGLLSSMNTDSAGYRFIHSFLKAMGYVE